SFFIISIFNNTSLLAQKANFSIEEHEEIKELKSWGDNGFIVEVINLKEGYTRLFCYDWGLNKKFELNTIEYGAKDNRNMAKVRVSPYSEYTVVDLPDLSSDDNYTQVVIDTKGSIEKSEPSEKRVTLESFKNKNDFTALIGEALFVGRRVNGEEEED